jgi:hypothetical protein
VCRDGLYAGAQSSVRKTACERRVGPAAFRAARAARRFFGKEKIMSTRGILLTLFLGATLAAASCGGGSSGGSSASSSGSSTSSSSSSSSGSGTGAINANQTWANDAVTSVDQGVAALIQADSASSLSSINYQSALAAIRMGTESVSGTINCSLLGNPSGDGSGTLSYDLTFSGSTPASITLTYSDCSWTNTVKNKMVSVNGTGAITYTNFTDYNDWTATLDWNGTLDVVWDGNTVFDGSYDGSATCTDSAGTVSCSYQFGNYKLSGSGSISTSGSTTTVTSATVTTTVGSSSESVTLTYSNWAFNKSLGYATSGTVTITDSSGDSATITALGSGSYSVSVTIGGTTTSYTVTVTSS